MHTPYGRRPFAQMLVLMASLVAAVSVGCSRGAPVPSADQERNDGVVARGRTAYQANCASCHGASGEGQPGWRTPRADGTYLPPPHDSSGHTWHHSDRQLRDIVTRGGQAVYGTAQFSSGMPSWGDRLSDDEIAAVLVYIKTLWGPKEREAQRTISNQDP